MIQETVQPYIDSLHSPAHAGESLVDVINDLAMLQNKMMVDAMAYLQTRQATDALTNHDVWEETPESRTSNNIFASGVNIPILQAGTGLVLLIEHPTQNPTGDVRMQSVEMHILRPILSWDQRLLSGHCIDMVAESQENLG